LVNEDVGAEPSASGPKKKKKSNKSRRKAIEALLLEEIASLDETSEGLEARKEKGGKKSPYEGATSSADHGEAPTVGREGAAEGPSSQTVLKQHLKIVPERRRRRDLSRRSRVLLMRRRAWSKLSREVAFLSKPLPRKERSQRGAVILLRVRDLFLIEFYRKEGEDRVPRSRRVFLQRDDSLNP